MRQRLSSVEKYALIACSLFLGTCVASWLSPVASTTEPKGPLNILIATEQDDGLGTRLDDQLSGTLASDSVQQLVQDPPRRSAFRPDFSRGLRRSNQRSNFFMLRAFHDAVGDSWKSTVRVNAEGQQVAMGMVVGADGWIITKASQLPHDGQIQCRLYDGSVIDAVECKRMVDIDLALLHIARDNLPVVKWDMSNVPDRGRWLATTDVQAGVPTAVGVVSAGAQSVQRNNAVLGVTLARPRGETSDQSGPGAYVDGVLKNTGAFLAGLRPGDLLVAVNGTSVAGLASFRDAVKDRMGGDYVTLSVNRNGSLFDIEGQLMDLSEELLDDTEMEVNGTVSARASDFSRVFTHDTVLEPNQCGGPLVNLDGRVVGINIARAGRVSSYALPVDVIKPAVDNLIEQAKLVSAPAEAKSSLRPIR